jgi:hypothetical protein
LINYYVYYKVAARDVERLRSRIAALFSAIEKETGVSGRWMRRRDDPATYMEVYERVRDADAFERILDRESAPLGLERRTERFVCA